MRLIVFVKIPGRVDMVPLDIIDDRPVELVFNDILLLTDLSKKGDKSNARYLLVKNGKTLNSKLNFYENGIRNNDILGIEVDANAVSVETDKEEASQLIPKSIIDKREKTGKPKSKSKQDKGIPPVPGKKIDFD